MRIYILIISLYVLLGCKYGDTHSPINKTDSSKFVLFLKNFDSLHLPLSIMKINDFGKYSDTIWQVINGSTQLVSNPVCKVIEKSNYDFIKDKYPTVESYHYMGLYKKRVNEYFLLIMKQNNYLLNEYWMKLCLYDKTGNLKDTLTIAGQKVNDYDCYCEIDTNLVISLRVIKELVSDENNNE